MPLYSLREVRARRVSSIWCGGAAVQKRDFVSRTSTNGNERLLDALIKLRKNEKMKGLKPEQLVSGH